MLELYHAPHSTCSQKVRICLAEKGVEWVDRRLNLATREHLTPEYLAINPNGVVPTLVHDDKIIIDSSVICEYLDEVFPAPRLLISASPATGPHAIRASRRGGSACRRGLPSRPPITPTPAFPSRCASSRSPWRDGTVQMTNRPLSAWGEG